MENRCLLSGSVSATVYDGDLYIYGDAQDNSLSLDTQNLPAGQVRLWGDATPINGVTGTPVVISRFTRNLYVFMGKGDDRFTVNASKLPGDVEIIPGLGDDAIVVNRADIGGLECIDRLSGD